MGLLSAVCVLEHITFDAKFVVERGSVLLTVKSCAVKKIMEANAEVRCVIFETLTGRFSLCMTTLHGLFFTRYERRMAAFLAERRLYRRNRIQHNTGRDCKNDEFRERGRRKNNTTIRKRRNNRIRQGKGQTYRYSKAERYDIVKN